MIGRFFAWMYNEKLGERRFILARNKEELKEKIRAARSLGYKVNGKKVGGN